MLVFFFQELNSIKNVSTFTKRKRNLSFSVFSFFVLFCLFVFFLEGGGGHLNFGKNGGHPKKFYDEEGGGGVIIFYRSFSSTPTSPHYPIKNERSLNLKS